MKFKVLDVGKTPRATSKSRAYLLSDSWDDWFTFSTLYSLIIFDDKRKRHIIGEVKIGETDMEQDQRRPNLPDEFESLDDTFFSLGQDSSYYERLNELGKEISQEVLAALRDVAADLDLFRKVRNEDVTKISLRRSVTRVAVQSQFHRLTTGGARLTKYKFKYKAPPRVGTGVPPIKLNFNVIPESCPPTNIHVLIGRNGVGKTYLLSSMTRALVDEKASSKSVGEFTSKDEVVDDTVFANLVSVTFSAFDSFIPLKERRGESPGIRYSYVGLKRPEGDKYAGKPKSADMLANEFVQSVQNCAQGARSHRWRNALETLEGDPIFKEAEIANLTEFYHSNDSEFPKVAKSLFNQLSSGHKIVLLTMTRLVETVEERTLVLLDEPEAHLHPPLLAAFVRALSDLLIDRNGVALIATHSPVILQEVPKSCVWKLRRSGVVVQAERPECETFGENVGVLTREVFGLEVTHSGFHNMLQDMVNEGESYEDILDRFDQEIGAEARSITRALISIRDSDEE